MKKLFSIPFVLLTACVAESEPSQPSPTGTHCVGEADYYENDQLVSKATEPVRCYDTFAEASAAATGGESFDLLVENDESSVFVTSVVGILFDATGSSTGTTSFLLTFGGEDIVKACLNPTSFFAINALSTFDNKASAAHGYNGCSKLQIFENTNLGGAVFNCTHPCNITGALNNNGSSFKVATP